MFKHHDTLVPSKTGFAAEVKRGQTVRIIDVEGEQVADFVAFKRDDYAERFDPSVTIDALRKISICQNDVLYSNRYRPMFTVTQDRVQRHDLLNSACRPEMYQFLYQQQQHGSCFENLSEALSEFAVPTPDQYYAFNIFMNTVVTPDGTVRVHRPKSRPGDFIDLHAEMDVIIGVSACPCEESEVNGYICTPLRVQVRSFA